MATRWSDVRSRLDPSRDLLAIGLLLGVVLASFVIRWSGIDWGRPFVYHPDEAVVVKPAIRMVASGDWNPHVFLYPSLLTDVEAGIVAIGHAFRGWPLETDQAWLFPTEMLPQQFGAFHAGRILVAALALITVAATFVIGRRLGGRVAGLVAAAVVALAPIHIESSRYVTTDVPVTLFCTLTLLASIRAVQTPDRSRWWIVAAVCVGLAASTKWNGVVVGIVPLSLYLAARLRPVDGSAGLRSRTPWLMALAASGAFVAATPAIVLAPGEVVDWLATQAGAYTSDAYAALRGSGTVNGVLVEIQAIVDGFGPAFVVLAFVGIVGLLTSRRRVEVAMALFVAVYVIILSIPVLHYPRNALPALPFVAIAIGLLPARAASAARRLARGAGRVEARGVTSRRVRWAAAALIVTALIPVLAVDIGEARRLRAADTRSIAYGWILANLPANAIIAREQYTPQLSPDRFRLRNHDGLYQRGMPWYRDQGVDYLVASSAIYGRYIDNPATPYDAAFYRALFDLPEVFRIDQSDARPGPTIRIFRLDPGTSSESGPRGRGSAPWRW